MCEKYIAVLQNTLPADGMVTDVHTVENVQFVVHKIKLNTLQKI